MHKKYILCTLLLSFFQAIIAQGEKVNKLSTPNNQFGILDHPQLGILILSYLIDDNEINENIKKSIKNGDINALKSTFHLLKYYESKFSVHKENPYQDYIRPYA